MFQVQLPDQKVTRNHPKMKLRWVLTDRPESMLLRVAGTDFLPLLKSKLQRVLGTGFLQLQEPKQEWVLGTGYLQHRVLKQGRVED